MFDVKVAEGNEILLFGRFDAAQVEKAKSIFDALNTSTIIDFKDLQYISSIGLGVLLMTQKRLSESGHALKLINLNKHIRDVFAYSGLDRVFEIR